MVEMRNLYAFPLPILKLFEYVELAFSLFFFFWPHLMACGILVIQPGIEPHFLAVRAQSPNH